MKDITVIEFAEILSNALKGFVEVELKNQIENTDEYRRTNELEPKFTNWYGDWIEALEAHIESRIELD